MSVIRFDSLSLLLNYVVVLKREFRKLKIGLNYILSLYQK